MKASEGHVVHPRYRGTAKWHVKAVAELPEPIRYADPVQGDVGYEPRILWLESPSFPKVLWFAYWIATSATGGKAKWGQGAPMLEEDVLLRLLKTAIAEGFFTRDFLQQIQRQVQSALE